MPGVIASGASTGGLTSPNYAAPVKWLSFADRTSGAWNVSNLTFCGSYFCLLALMIGAAYKRFSNFLPIAPPHNLLVKILMSGGWQSNYVSSQIGLMCTVDIPGESTLRMFDSLLIPGEDRPKF